MITYIIIRTIAVLGASYVTKVGVPLVFGTVSSTYGTIGYAIATAFVIAVINHTIKPFFMLISIPINLVTLGLFSFVINGLMILLAEKILTGLGVPFYIPTLLMAIYFSIVLAIVNWLLHIFK